MRLLHRLLMACPVALSLAACQTTPKLNVYSSPIDLEIMQPGAPAPVKMKNVNFRVVNKDNFKAFVDEQIKMQGNPNPVFVVISLKDYQAMSLNLADIKRYIDQQQQIIIYYKKATAPKAQ